MTDNEVIIILSKYKLIKWSLLKLDIKNYLLNRFSDNYSTNIFYILKESYYRILNNIDICPSCPICKNKCKFNGSEYLITCGNPKCVAKECQTRREKTFFEKYKVHGQFSRNVVKEKIKETNIIKYGVDNPWKTKEIQNKCKSTIIKNNGGLGAASEKIKEKMEKTNLEKYGWKHNWQDPEEQKRSHSDEAKRKMKKTCLEKYGCEIASQSNIVKQHRKETCLKKYGVSHEMKLKSQVEKVNEAKRKNHTFNTSIPENESYKLLKEKYPDVNYQYKSDVYPFACDFYIPSLNLYIECNYHWTHGGKPFEGTEKDKEILKFWESKNTQYYRNAIKCWTIRDVNKRNKANENDLNLIEFWNINELKIWLNNKF